MLTGKKEKSYFLNNITSTGLSKILAVVFVLLASFGFSFANDSIFHIYDDGNYNLSKNTGLYFDKKEELSIDDFINSKIELKALEQNYFSPDSCPVIWAVIDIKNESTKYLEWVLTTGGTAYITLYTLMDGTVKSTFESGYLQAYHKHNIPQYVYQIKLNIPKNKKTTLVLKHKAVTKDKIAIYPTLFPYTKHIETRSEINYLQGGFHGIIIIMILYHLFIFLSVKDKSLIHYSFYLISILLAFLFPFGYMWAFIGKGWHLIGRMLMFCVQGAATYFYLTFMQSFVQLKQNLPKCNRIIAIAKLVLVVATSFAAIHFLISKDDMVGFSVVNVTILALLITSIIILIPIYKLKNLLSNYFIIGSLTLFIAALIGVSLIISEYRLGTQQYIIQAGVISQILIFALGLGKKIQITEKDRQKAQLELIAQLEENQALQTKVNRELEEKVKERTARIRQANEEIMAQRDDLEEANRLLETKNEEINHQKTELEKSHNDIKDSINYASRIQLAVLPKSKEINDSLPDHFIMFRPRDVVSGDFYFIKKIDTKVVVMAADCTGHGVPGAFMSILGISLLNEIIRKNIDISAAEILDRLRHEVKTSLNQTGKKGEQQDGMDAALCIIDSQSNLLNYAGAYNPLWVYRKENDETNLIEIKANTQPVGIYFKETAFKNHSIQLEDNDMLYIFSDGYNSQFGGEDNKTYKSKKLKSFLANIFQQSTTMQKIQLEEEFDNWKGDNSQLDDVLLIGIRAKFID